jgi:tetratricopeptide (TPR) repeat protein
MKFTKTLVLSTILFAFCLLTSNAYSQDLLQVGIDKIQKRDYKGAIEDLKKAIEKTPKSSKAHFYLGEAYYFTKQYDNAEVSLKKTIDLDDEYALGYKRLGDVYSVKKLYREALIEYTKAVKLEKKNAEFLMAQGYSYLDVDSVDRAINTFSQAQVYDPKNPAIMVALGDAYLKMNVPVMAVDNYKKAIEIDSTYANAHKKLGDVYYQKMRMYKDALNEYIIYANLDSTNSDNLGRVGHLLFYNKIYPTAITFYEKLVKIDQSNYDAYTELGASHMYLKEFDKAAESLEIAVKLDPKPVDATRYLANTYWYNKNYKKAFDKFGALEKIDTLKADEYAKWARVSLGVPDSASAITLFKKAIEVDPELDVYSELALIFQKQKRNKEAAEFYSKKAERDTTPNKVRYYVAAGQFYNSEKESDKALECFSKALVITPNDAKIYFYLGFLYQQYPKNDSLKQSLECFREYLNLVDKSNGDVNKDDLKTAYFILGEHEFKVTKNFGKAMSYFDLILKIKEANEPALMYKALCYMGLNQKEDACKAFDRVLKLFPKNKDADDMKKKNQCWMFK